MAVFGEMIACEPRMQTYAAALEEAVTPGCTVIDIGAGFGIFSLLACQYGAGHVIAIDPDPAIELLPALARDNECSDKITIVRDLSTRFETAEKADVLISDIRGILPLFESHIATIRDARDRLLKPGGAQLPMRDTIRIALVKTPTFHDYQINPWQKNRYGLDLSRVRSFADDTWRKARFQPDALLSDVADLAVLDYRSIENESLDAAITLFAQSDCVAHGFALWFDAEIAPGHRFTNAPGEPEQVYGQSFFPFRDAVRLAGGDAVNIRLRATRQGADYIWTWETEVDGRADAGPAQRFRQSSFRSHPIAPGSLKGRESKSVPNATEKLLADRACLELVDGNRSLGEIAGALQSRFPAIFASHGEAVGHASSLIGKYMKDEGPARIIQTGKANP